MYRAMRGSLLICALLLSISGMAEAVQHTTAIYQLESTTATFLRVHLSREGLQNLKNEKSPYHLAITSEANSFHHEQLFDKLMNQSIVPHWVDVTLNSLTVDLPPAALEKPSLSFKLFKQFKCKMSLVPLHFAAQIAQII